MVSVWIILKLKLCKVILENYSRAGIWTRVSRVRAVYPDQLDYAGCSVVLSWRLLRQLYRIDRREWIYMIHSILYSALVAQMVERKTLNLVVVGSSPTEGAFFFNFIHHLQVVVEKFSFEKVIHFNRTNCSPSRLVSWLFIDHQKEVSIK